MTALTSKFYVLDSGVEFNIKQSFEKALELTTAEISPTLNNCPAQ